MIQSFTEDNIDMALYSFMGKQVAKKTLGLCWCKFFPALVRSMNGDSYNAWRFSFSFYIICVYENRENHKFDSRNSYPT